VVKAGYALSMTGTAASGAPACNGSSLLATGFHAWADPISATTGTRFFLINGSGTVWQSTASLSAAGTDSGAPSGGQPIQ